MVRERCLVMIALKRNVLIWGGNCISGFLSLLRLNTGFLYYTMSTLWRSLCIFTKGMKGWAYKHEKKGNKGKWRHKGNEGNGYTLGTRAGPSLLSQADPSCIMSFMLVLFSWMPIWSWSCRSARLALFSLRGSQLGLFFFKLPPFPPASPTRSVSIQILVTDCGNSASG
jgi:hypothetical protein